MINSAEGTPDSYFYPEHANATWNDPARSGKAQPWPEVAKRYATMVRRIDDCVEDLMVTLRDLGIERDTLVVFTTDNGPSQESYLTGKDANGYSRAADPGFLRDYGPFDGIKRDCYEGGVRVGALVRWPGTVPAGKISTHASQFHDWMATLCDVAGIPAPARTDGVSLLPELTDKGERPDSSIYVEYQVKGKTPNEPDFLASRRKGKRNQMQLVRSGDLVGVRYNIHSQDDDFEIYDVVKDLGQRMNLAAEKKDLQKHMKERVLRVRRPNESASRPYMDNLPIPPSAPTVSTAPGLEARVFPQVVPWPISDRCVPPVPPIAVVGAEIPDNSITGRHGVVFRGWLLVPAEGDYAFFVPAGCRAVFKLYEATVLDTDRGNRAAPVRLAAGFHPLVLSVETEGKLPSPLLSWPSPGRDKEVVPASRFVRAP